MLQTLFQDREKSVIIGAQSRGTFLPVHRRLLGTRELHGTQWNVLLTQQRLHSETNRVSSSTITKNMRGQMKILTRLDHLVSNDSFPSVRVLEF
jgi:hypothetical protein